MFHRNEIGPSRCARFQPFGDWYSADAVYIKHRFLRNRTQSV